MSKAILKVLINILILICTIGCLNSNRASIKFDTYRLKYKLPFVKSNGELIYLNDSAELVYYRDYVIAKINSENIRFIKNDSSEFKNNCKYLLNT